jgi:predicted HAD superfamily Cof-like phosphohydrolase
MSNESKLIPLDIEPRSAIEVLQDPPKLPGSEPAPDFLPQSTLENVRAFHKAFNCELRDKPEIPDGPHTDKLQVLYDKLMMLRAYARQFAKEDNRCQRVALNIEESAEEVKALMDRDIVALLDAGADKDFINCGTQLCYGLGDVFYEACNRVYESNMSKLEDGKPVYDETGKVKKGKDYKPVDLSDLIK